jgi:tetratricopeptide (TPR) repeat protein
MRKSLHLLCAGAFALVAGSAQMQSYPQNSRGIPVHGEIESGTVISGNVTVELAATGASRGDTTPVSPDGRFEFQSIAAGTYWLRVVAGDGRVIHEEAVTINGSQQMLQVRLSADQKANRADGSSISMQQLTHKVPRAAQKAYEKGLHAASKGDQRMAADFFSQAVDADPEFVDAHNELGAAEVKLGQLPEAAEQFQKAIDLAPEHRMALPNLSIVLAKMRRFGEAGEVARRALRVVPGMAQMQYILALGLLSEHKEPQEAIRNLRSAAHEIPKAHIVAAEALVECGKRDEAALELEQYLSTQPPNDAERAKVEAALAELRQ